MINFAVILFAFVVFSLSASFLHLFHIEYFRPDLLSIFVSYFAMRRKWEEGLILSVILGSIFAVFHGVSVGLFILCAFFVFAFVRLSSLRLNLKHLHFLAGFMLPTVLVGQLFMLSAMNLFSSVSIQWSSGVFIGVVYNSLASMIVALPIFLFIDWLENKLKPVRSDNYLLR